MDTGEKKFDFEAVPTCMLCASDEQHDVKGVSWKGVPFSYSLCGKCGLKYMNPRPTFESYQRFFKESYWQDNLAATGFPSVAAYSDKKISQLELRMKKYEQVYARLKLDIGKVMELDSSSRVLEVGCAFGYSLEWLHRDYKCKVDGIEPSSEAVRRCEQAGCITMVAGTAEEFLYPGKQVPADQKYDVIFFRHCLETLPDPRPVLRSVREHLRPSGLLLVYTANVEYHDAMSPYAPFIFSPETMGRLLRTCGLEPFRIDAPPSPRTHEIAVRVLDPRHELVAFARPCEPATVEHPHVDPMDIVRTIELGHRVVIWNALTPTDVAARYMERAQRFIRRT
jgi:2-polyprenyl-3-methyl-5-hydroxy-6-metoxy-1,4-benzoquinol methylase